MHRIDHTRHAPAENLAFDEALLEAAETDNGTETLRFWEPVTPFVVVGYSNRVDTEVDRAACEARRVPVLRRCSGGGTVVQGPGCLNYNLVLRIDQHPPLAGLTETNRFVMERHRSVVERLLGTNAGAVTFDGHTDLALDGRKFSGNAQRRKRRYVLFHGCFLLAADLDLITALLPLPSREPAYRQNRPHTEFLVNLPLTATDLKRALAEEWGADTAMDDSAYPLALTRRLVDEKYNRPEWNQRR